MIQGWKKRLKLACERPATRVALQRVVQRDNLSRHNGHIYVKEGPIENLL